MATFIGFNTIGQDKKFTLTDFDLIKRDLLNAFNIRDGEMPGRPDVGSKIWEYIFDPNDSTLERQIKAEITRIVDADTRIKLKKLIITQEHNVVTAAMRVDIAPNATAEELFVLFDKDSQKASIR